MKMNNKSNPINDLKYPKAVFLIIATEFCERFSFCGLRTILSLYLRNVLLFEENKATITFHVFIMLCYFVPVIGAITADSYFGRFRTIVLFSINYVIGTILICVGATPPIALSPILMTYIGLILIGVGTGGIKPCVAPFGADQFQLPEQQKLFQNFFAIFYFTINAGGLLGMILMPILRSFTCFHQDTCYSLGFGLPATLMLITIWIFILGEPIYNIKYPKENIMLKFIQCILYALKQKYKSKQNINKNHWLDYAEDKFPKKLISEVKIVFELLILYIPLPFFWSLFDQQGSRWTFQASRMERSAFGFQILPDQFQIINPAMVLLLIPIFEKTIYIWFTKLFCSPLRRMIIGGVIAGLAFVASGMLELKLKDTYPILPTEGQSIVHLINTLKCDVGILPPFSKDFTLHAHEKQSFILPTNNKMKYDLYLVSPSKCFDIEFINSTLSTSIISTELQVNTFIIGTRSGYLNLLFTGFDKYEKSFKGHSKLKIIFQQDSLELDEITIVLKAYKLPNKYFTFSTSNPFWESEYIEIDSQLISYEIYYKNKIEVKSTDILMESGGVYLLMLKEYNEKIQSRKIHSMAPGNRIHILWMIPQYLLISIAEVMFAISGLEFSFSQAPKSMKTVTIAIWYLSVAFGNLVVIIVTEVQFFENQSDEFFFFAGLILINIFIFTFLTTRYTFISLESDSDSLFVSVIRDDDK